MSVDRGEHTETATSELTAVLVVGDWNTACSECGWNVDVSETHHLTVLPGYPTRAGQPDRGCGALFVGMRRADTARIVPDVQPCGWVAKSRPDLPLVVSS